MAKCVWDVRLFKNPAIILGEVILILHRYFMQLLTLHTLGDKHITLMNYSGKIVRNAHYQNIYGIAKFKRKLLVIVRNLS
jgi:hypothetical protein